MPQFPDEYTEKETPTGADNVLIADSAASNAIKRLTLTNLITFIKTTLQAVTGWISTAMLADNAITPAKWTNPCCFRLEESTTSLTDNINTKVVFDTEVYDYSNMVAASTFTAPFDGVFHFDSTIILGTTTSAVFFNSKLYKNGAAHTVSSSSTGISNSSAIISADLLLEAGDTIEVYGYQNTAGNEAIDNSTPTLNFFSGHLVQKV